MGVSTNIATAYLISRVRAQTLAVVSALITMTAPIIMATTKIDEEYWFAPFWAMLLSPVNPDGILLSKTQPWKSYVLTCYSIIHRLQPSHIRRIPG